MPGGSAGGEIEHEKTQEPTETSILFGFHASELNCNPVFANLVTAFKEIPGDARGMVRTLREEIVFGIKNLFVMQGDEPRRRPK